MAAKLEGPERNRSAETRDPKIAGVGELLWDLLPGGARLGGTISNFALLCARLGNRAVLVSSVGDDDYGRTAISMLLQPNLDLQQLQVSAAHPTGTVEVTFSADNQPSYLINPGVAWDFIELTPGLLEATRDVNAICFGTLAQRHEVSRSTIRGLVEGTAAECVRVCDINIRMPYCTPEVLHWSMGHATIIKVSEEELPLAFSFLRELGLARQPASITPETAARFLLETFPKCQLVATTLGADGCVVTNREGTFRHPGFAIELVDTVGAGDAFTAALVDSYLRGASLARMNEAGNRWGGWVASQPGAMPELNEATLADIQAKIASA